MVNFSRFSQGFSHFRETRSGNNNVISHSSDFHMESKNETNDSERPVHLKYCQIPPDLKWSTFLVSVKVFHTFESREVAITIPVVIRVSLALVSKKDVNNSGDCVNESDASVYQSHDYVYQSDKYVYQGDDCVYQSNDYVYQSDGQLF